MSFVFVIVSRRVYYNLLSSHVRSAVFFFFCRYRAVSDACDTIPRRSEDDERNNNNKRNSKKLVHVAMHSIILHRTYIIIRDNCTTSKKKTHTHTHPPRIPLSLISFPSNLWDLKKTRSRNTARWYMVFVPCRYFRILYNLCRTVRHRNRSRRDTSLYIIK